MYDLLGREVELREKRQTVLARTLEIQEVVLLGDDKDANSTVLMLMMRRLRPDYATLPNM